MEYGFYNIENNNYLVTNELGKNDSMFKDFILIAEGKKANDLLYKSKGENGRFINKRFKDQKYNISVNEEMLIFIETMGIHYLKHNFNKISIVEFRFFMKCMEKLYEIRCSKLRKIINSHFEINPKITIEELNSKIKEKNERLKWYIIEYFYDKQEIIKKEKLFLNLLEKKEKRNI